MGKYNVGDYVELVRGTHDENKGSDNSVGWHEFGQGLRDVGEIGVVTEVNPCKSGSQYDMLTVLFPTEQTGKSLLIVREDEVKKSSKEKMEMRLKHKMMDFTKTTVRTVTTESKAKTYSTTKGDNITVKASVIEKNGYKTESLQLGEIKFENEDLSEKLTAGIIALSSIVKSLEPKTAEDLWVACKEFVIAYEEDEPELEEEAEETFKFGVDGRYSE